MVLTALAIIYVPFGAVTSRYGVNALEFVDGAYTHIRTVWEVAASVTVASLGVPLFGLLALSSVVYATQQGILMTILD
jgi:Mg2+ and Co2+ transporter CorA